MKIIIEYWRSDALIVNLGDFIVEALLNRIGLEYKSYSWAIRNGGLEPHDRCFLGVGTMIDAYWFDYIGIPKDIWGCGYGGDSRLLDSPLRSEAVFHAVRGPKTRDILGLDSSIPLGDPGLLLPLLFPIQPDERIDIGYIPHFETRDSLPRDTLQRIGATKYIDIACRREEFLERLKDIVCCRFVLTSSLHGAIIAQAYGVPWALCCPPGIIHNMPFKWDDWFEYMGIKAKFCSDYADAENWWSCHGCMGRIRDLEPLIKSFPVGDIII